MVFKSALSHQIFEKGVNLASVIFTIYNIISKKADICSWLTIPLTIQIGHMRLPSGRHLLDLNLRQADRGGPDPLWRYNIHSEERRAQTGYLLQDKY